MRVFRHFAIFYMVICMSACMLVLVVEAAMYFTRTSNPAYAGPGEWSRAVVYEPLSGYIIVLGALFVVCLGVVWVSGLWRKRQLSA